MKNKPIIIQDSVNYGIGINSPTEELNSLEKAENIEAVARIIFRHEYPTEDTAIIFLKDFIKAELSAQLNTIINDLETNPNEDGSTSPNIQHWIERKQSQLKRKYLD